MRPGLHSTRQLGRAACGLHQTLVCIDNLRAIEGAVEQAKMEELATVTDIYGDDKPIKEALTCPVNKAAYVLTGAEAADWVPVCPNVGTYPEHKLSTGP